MSTNERTSIELRPSGAGEITTTPPDPETARIEREIEQTRAEMTRTLGALEDRFKPSELQQHLAEGLQMVETKVREVMREQIDEVKTAADEKLTDAKNLLRAEVSQATTLVEHKVVETKNLLKSEFFEIRDAVKSDIREAITGAKQAARAATIGRVEDLATDLGDAMNRTRETLVETIRENPIPAAIAGIGLAWLFMNRSRSVSRRTRMIDEGYGYYGYGEAYGAGGYDRTHDRRVTHALTDVRDAAGGALHRVGDAVGTAAHRVSDAVGTVAHRVGDTTTNAAHRVGDAAESAMHTVQEKAGSVAHAVGETASQLAHRVSDTTSNAMHRVQDTAQHTVEATGKIMHDAGETASQLVHRAGDAAVQLKHRAGDVATNIARGARTQAIRVERTFERTLEENPIALGAAALATGAVVGFLLPNTPQEDALMGEARDAVLRKAEHAAQGALESVAHMTERTAERARTTLRDAGKLA